LHHDGQSPTNSDGGRKLSQQRRNSMWDPLIHHSPLLAVKESSYLTEGITGITIGKRRINNNRPATSSIENTKSTTKSTLPRLYVKDHGKRKYHRDNMKIEIIIKNGLLRGRTSDSKISPLECFKITSLNSKRRE